MTETGFDDGCVGVYMCVRADVRFSELLERRGGIYRQRLVIQPGSVVADMSVRTSFAERQGFTYFAYKLPGQDTEMTASSDKNKVGEGKGIAVGNGIL